jgi:hypothetical protein
MKATAKSLTAPFMNIALYFVFYDQANIHYCQLIRASQGYFVRRFNSEVQQRCIDDMAEHRGWGKWRGQGHVPPSLEAVPAARFSS